MTNNTIPNVPRELEPCPFCGSEAGRATKKATWNLSRHRVACTNSGCGAHYGYWHPIEWNARALLSAPSPAGVDADHVEDVRAMVAAPSPAGADGLELDRNEAYQACPDSGCDWGSFWQGWKARHAGAQASIDQQAQRIGELEGLLREAGKTIHKLQAEQPTPARIARYLDAMRAEIAATLSAGKEGE